jgi:thiol-disulfide isomerase/thioredoxin
MLAPLMIQIGPFTLPATPLIVLLALGVGVFVGRRTGGSRSGDIENALYTILLCGLLAARLAFVMRYWDSYRYTLPDVLDIRDGGFLTWPGLVGGFIVTLLIWRTMLPTRGLLVSVFAGALTMFAGLAAARIAHGDDATIKLPAQTFQTVDGKPLALSAFRGKPMVINLWASWCPPCRHEMPVMQKAQAANQDVVFVFANQGESKEDARRYLQSEHLDIVNVLLDTDGDVAHQANAKGLPTTLFFDTTGRLASMRVGELSQASLAQRLESIRIANGTAARKIAIP